MTPPIRMVSVPRSAVERLILAADSYGVRYLDSDDLSETAQELQNATEDMKDALTAAPVREEGGAVLTGISLDGQQGEPAGMMTVKAHFSDGSESVLIRDNGNVISHWKNVDALATREDAQPVAVTIFCPECSLPHVDEGEWATTRRHKTHQCQDCGHEWRPFPFATVGVSHPTTPPAPEAEKLRVAVEALEEIKSKARPWASERAAKALAALQTEQKGGAA